MKPRNQCYVKEKDYLDLERKYEELRIQFDQVLKGLIPSGCILVKEFELCADINSRAISDRSGMLTSESLYNFYEMTRKYVVTENI